jgi:hypothetical protein
MTRDAAFWTMVIGLIVIPGLALGLLRGRAITRAYFRIYADLKKSGVELSQAELKVLMTQLHRNPKAVLDADSVHESRGIKEQHIQALMSYLKPIRYGFGVLVVVAVVALFLFQHLWPNK